MRDPPENWRFVVRIGVGQMLKDLQIGTEPLLMAENDKHFFKIRI